MSVSDWLIAGVLWETQTPNIAGQDQDVTAALGGLYLISQTPSLSLLARVIAAMSGAGIDGATAFITEDRHVRIASSGANFNVAWNLATTLRDLLGFNANLSGASAYTAPLRSPLLWSPGKRLTPLRAPIGAPGEEVPDLSMTVGPVGRIVVREEGEPTYKAEWLAQHVARDRYWTPPGYEAGEYSDFWRTHIRTVSRFHWWMAVGEGDSSTTSADYAAAATLGPYRGDMTDRAMQTLKLARSSGFQRVEAFYDVSIAALLTSEFTA